MPSFLNKVFGYKKHDDKETARPTREASGATLLDGKYEAISPNVSPSATTFTEAQTTKDPDRDVGFSLFRPKSRGVSQKSGQKHPEAVPHLTLQLPGPKESPDSRALGVVFEADPDSQMILDDVVIAAKRLSPLETLILVRACAQTITERGLETLGVMHPHWLSASPDVQRRLISLFIRSLTPQSRITTLSPTPTSAMSAFENELHYTRSPHDVAAVLRWGLRHLSLENGHFGKDSAEWAWYNTFFHAERSASYPPKGFSELLLPQLPTSHIELLTTTLSLISSLASHAETNSISGSKLSKFFGVWLLVATRGEQADDWNRFYARWERAGRILEHLFLARLREESFGQRLPLRLQELVKYYPYNKGSPTTEEDLLSRPRFSTRQYDALFVRVETLLVHSAEQPKQHPIQLLLEAFQLPVENPSGNEHMALWNTLKTTASGEAASPDPEGLQFTRILVDETIQLLSLIPADNNASTSPSLLTSPVTKVVSRKRSSSFTKALERAVSKSNAFNGSTPVSPTSPSSIVITDWTQFSLSGFGDSPSTKPLAALLNPDDDIEITQPRISRKSSRRSGKSRTRRRRSEDREPSDTPASAQHELESSIVETKLASVHAVQIDEAFIDFWSDAIVDPISANWPTFVVCGLKQIPSVEQPIHWLVIEQTYSRQQPPRDSSPDGRRGRSPRPSFRSDISGFRINSMFSSARKRFSVFSKSVTDLDPKKSGGRSPMVGELGEVLIEEESTFPSAPPTKADHAAVGATVTSGATADLADQLKVDEISTVPTPGGPPADLVPVLEEESDSVRAATKAPSIEPTPQSGGEYNSFSELPRSSVKSSNGAVGQGSPRPLDVVNPKVNAADSVTKTAPLAADTSNSQSIQGTSDPTVLASPRALPAETPVVEEVRVQEELRQGIVLEAEDRVVELVAQQSSDLTQLGVVDSSREAAEAVAMPPASETVVQRAVVGAADDEAPTPEAPHVVEESSRKVPVDFVAASTVESVGQHGMEVIATETGTQLEPDSIASVADAVEEVKEVAEHTEIPTPAPKFVVLVEDTPGPEISVDACVHAEATRIPVAEPKALEDAALEPVTAESQPIVKAEESSAIHPVQTPPVEIILAVDTSAQLAAVKIKHAADHVPELVTEEVNAHVQDTIFQPAEASLIETLPAPGVETYVSTGTVSAVEDSEDISPAEVEAQTARESLVSETHVVEAQDTGAPIPVLDNATLFYETLRPEIAVDDHEPVEATPAVVRESEAVKDREPEPAVEAIVEAKAPPTESIPLAGETQPSTEVELPTQVPEVHLAETSSAESIPEAANAALASVDEIVARKAEAQPTPDAHVEDAEARTSTTEGAPIEDSLRVTTEASELAEVVPAEPIIPEAPPLVECIAPSASESAVITPIVIIEEPVAQDPEVLIEIEEPSSESTPQSVDEATNAPLVVGSVPEEIIDVKVEAQLEPEAVHTTVSVVDVPQEDAKPAPLMPEVGVLAEETEAVVDTSEPETFATESELAEVCARAPVVEEAQTHVAVEGPSPASVEGRLEVEIDETGEVNESQERVGHLAGQPVTFNTDIPTHEPAGIYTEIAPAEP